VRRCIGYLPSKPVTESAREIALTRGSQSMAARAGVENPGG
jgi:hypothetical protein